VPIVGFFVLKRQEAYKRKAEGLLGLEVDEADTFGVLEKNQTILENCIK